MTAAATTIDPAETQKFAAMAAEWWDPKGKFAPLHRLNPTRLTHLRAEIITGLALTDRARRPFEGLSIVDLGCGGGLITEPMARLGANVMGLDADPVTLEIARAHAAQSRLAVEYRQGSAEGLATERPGGFDVVLALEIVEHVADVQAFVRAAAAIVRPGGLVMFSTLNRTPQAYALAIVAAERVLRWVPAGTHAFEKFVTPKELTAACAAAGLSTAAPVGLVYNPLSRTWRLGADVGVNYFLTARRAPLPHPPSAPA